MEKRVGITGIGAITPIGNNVPEYWAALSQGKSGIEKTTLFDVSQFTSQIAGEVKGFEPEKYIDKKEARRMDRFAQFAMAATFEAIQDSKLDLSKEDTKRIGVLLGSGIGGLGTIEKEHKVLLEKGPRRVSPFLIPMLIIDIASGMVSIKYGLKGPNFAVVTACASSAHAMGDAFKIIQRGDAEAMVTGGAEGAITPLGLAGFCSMKALSTRNDDPHKASRPFDKERDGFIMAEGAGIIILESLEHAKARGAKVYAEVVGYGMSGDAYHMTAPAPEGEGAANAMQMALDDAEMKPEEVDYINAHGTSTLLNDKYEAIAIKKVFGKYAKEIPVSSTKSMTGHLLGATGGAELIACLLALEKGIIPPTMNYEYPDPDCQGLDFVPNQARKKEVKVAMSNSFGFGGHNAVLIIKKLEK
ncbi:beta-ketoacyl-ACP synthase II [bacterium]|nr:beta-ketoacyl-ACP synthase II [bacterium]